MKLTNNNKQQEFFDLLEDPKASNKERRQAFSDVLDEQTEKITDMIRNETLQANRQGYKVKGFTNTEVQFFNEEGLSVTDGEKILPIESIERIFDDLIQRHDLLRELGVCNAMLRLNIITVEPTEAYAWGVITGAIKGKIQDAFKEKLINQGKLTAYTVIPNDILQYGPEYVYDFFSRQLDEVLFTALEEGYIKGQGTTDAQHPQPIGLTKQLASPNTDKDSAGTLTMTDPAKTIHEMGEALSKISVDEKGKTRTAMNNVLLIVNNADLWRVKALFTVQNAAGEYVTATPFGIKLIGSAAAPKGKAVFVAADYYDAFIGGELDVKGYDQTLALEDAMLLVGKTFAYGEPRDENVSVVYDLPEVGGAVKSRSAKGE